MAAFAYKCHMMCRLGYNIITIVKCVASRESEFTTSHVCFVLILPLLIIINYSFRKVNQSVTMNQLEEIFPKLTRNIICMSCYDLKRWVVYYCGKINITDICYLTCVLYLQVLSYAKVLRMGQLLLVGGIISPIIPTFI